MNTTRDRPIFAEFPALRVPFVPLGIWPTPVEAFSPRAYVKRDDLSSPLYGGNKVRTLEVLFGEALERGATHIVSTGAFGSNHGAATLIHAPRAGLIPELALFPQPVSTAAQANLRVLEGHARKDRGAPRIMPHWSALPLSMMAARVHHRVRGHRPFVMVPGGATPRGALGYVNAAFELAAQIDAGDLPAPDAIYVGAGSTCTAAGLLLGTMLAFLRGRGWKVPPRIVAVRVTPWPVTSARRIVGLAVATGRYLARAAADASAAVDRSTLSTCLEVDADQLGDGYGIPTAAGRDAIVTFRDAMGLELDTTYSAKTAASILRAIASGPDETSLFWSTKSTAPLPPVTSEALAAASRRVRSFLAR